jgi:AraC-like DNA-binding protein
MVPTMTSRHDGRIGSAGRAHDALAALRASGDGGTSRTLRGPGWLLALPDGEHLGLKVWGRPSATDALSEVIDAIGWRSRFVAVDLRALVVSGEHDLGQLGQLLSSLLAHTQRSGSQLAIFRPTGLGGAVVTGVLAAFTQLSAVQLPVDALDGLAAFDPRAVRLVRMLLGPLDAAEAEVPFADDPELKRLRVLLRQNPRDLTLEGVAKLLGTSVRSLQRKLSGDQTTFSHELQRARVDAAKKWLLTTTDKVEAIAERVGCCSHQHLARLFRRHARESPLAFRRRHEG